MPTGVARAILRTPGIERYTNMAREFLEQLATEVVYDDRNTRELLEGTGISCPPVEDYVGAMVGFVRAHEAERRAKQVEVQIHEDDLPFA